MDRMISRDVAFTKYIFERAKTVKHPAPRAHVVRDFGKKNGMVVNGRGYERGFERIIERIFKSDHPPSLIARACFLLSIPVTDDEELMEKLNKIADIKLDEEGRIRDYKSKSRPVIKFSGYHRKIMKAVKNRRETMNHLQQREQREQVEQEEDNIEEEPAAPQVLEDPEMAYEYDFDEQPIINRGFPDARMDEPEVKAPKIDQKSALRQAVEDRAMVYEHFDYEEKIVNPSLHNAHMDEPEVKIAHMMGMSDGDMAPGPSSRRFSSTVPSIGSLHNHHHQWENQYSNFLKGTHIFLQDFSKKHLELKKLARDAREKNEGANLSPQTMMAYFEVCLGDIIFLERSPRVSEGTVNLNEFLQELRKSAEDFGFELERLIIPVVDQVGMNIGDNENVNLESIIETFSNMVKKVQTRASHC